MGELVRLVILCPPRTGSSLLSTAMNAVEDQLILLEPFHGTWTTRQNHHRDTIKEKMEFAVCPIETPPTEYFKKLTDFAAATNKYRVVGFKSIYPQHSLQDTSELIKNCDVVITRTRDLLSIVCSFMTAKASSAWNHRDTKNRKASIEVPFYEYEWLRSMYKDHQREVEILRESGLPFFEFAYETPLEEMRKALAPHAIKLGEPTTSRVRPEHPSSCISNLDEVRKWIDDNA